MGKIDTNIVTKTVAEHLVDFLERRDVKHVFGLCGHTNIAVLAAMAESPIDFITVRHEQIASHAADGYARITGRASVVLSHLSPGLTNCATGVANAAMDCIPMVVIAGDIPTHYYGKHPHQEVNLHADAQQYEIYRPFVKRAWRVDRAELIAEILEKAFHLAESGQPGPVLVNVPMDIFSEKISSTSFDRIKSNTRNLIKPSIDDQTAARIVTQLAKAKSPVIYAGGGILLAQAAKELQEFVDHMQIPVAHSLMGKGAIRDDHPMVLGMTGFWGTELVNQTCLNADWLFAIGTRFKEADCSSWYPGYTFNIPGTKVIHVDIEPSEIGRNYPVEIGAVADAKSTLATLTRVAKELYPQGFKRGDTVNQIATFRREFKASNSEMATSNGFPMMPERILAETRRALPEDAIVTLDTGNTCLQAADRLAHYQSPGLITPLDFGLVGFGMPAAIGAKAAAPDRPVVAIMGDGSMGYTMIEVQTAVSHKLPVIFIVLDNQAWGAEKAYQQEFFGGRLLGAEIDSPRYDKFAELCGARGFWVEGPGDMGPALEEALASGNTCVIQGRIDPGALRTLRKDLFRHAK